MATVATLGDHGKPRPALIIQADIHAEHPSITVLPLTSEPHDTPTLRILVEPGIDTGLRLRSQAMVDKATTVARTKAGSRIGQLDEATLANVSQALAAFLGLGRVQQRNSREGRGPEGAEPPGWAGRPREAR